MCTVIAKGIQHQFVATRGKKIPGTNERAGWLGSVWGEVGNPQILPILSQDNGRGEFVSEEACVLPAWQQRSFYV